MTYIRSSSGPVNANPEILTASAAEIANVKINSNIKAGTIAAAGTSKFKWDPTSTAPASDTVIVPNDGTNPGRWLIETISASDLPKADSETAGVITLSGDITGIFDSIKVSQVNNQRVPWKNSVRFALTSNIPVLSSFAIAQSEGTAVANDRILLTGQTAKNENGIYSVGAISGGNAALTRSSDMSSSADCVVGSKIHVSEGALFANTEWVLGTQGTITLGSTALQFTPERCNTIAALKLVSGISNGQKMQLTSHTLLNDNGGGEFVWRTVDAFNALPADDGGVNIRVTGNSLGWWRRQTSGNAIDVRWFGAIGDYEQYTNGQNATANSNQVPWRAASFVDGSTYIGKHIEFVYDSGAGIYSGTITDFNSGTGNWTVSPTPTHNATSQANLYATDNTAAFQAAANFANTLTNFFYVLGYDLRSARLFVPRGTYYVPSPIVGCVGMTGDNATIRGNPGTSNLFVPTGGSISGRFDFDHLVFYNFHTVIKTWAATFDGSQVNLTWSACKFQNIDYALANARNGNVFASFDHCEFENSRVAKGFWASLALTKPTGTSFGATPLDNFTFGTLGNFTDGFILVGGTEDGILCPALVGSTTILDGAGLSPLVDPIGGAVEGQAWIIARRLTNIAITSCRFGGESAGMPLIRLEQEPNPSDGSADGTSISISGQTTAVSSSLPPIVFADAAPMRFAISPDSEVGNFGGVGKPIEWTQTALDKLMKRNTNWLQLALELGGSSLPNENEATITQIIGSSAFPSTQMLTLERTFSGRERLGFPNQNWDTSGTIFDASAATANTASTGTAFNVLALQSAKYYSNDGYHATGTLTKWFPESLAAGWYTAILPYRSLGLGTSSSSFEVHSGAVIPLDVALEDTNGEIVTASYSFYYDGYSTVHTHPLVVTFDIPPGGSSTNFIEFAAASLVKGRWGGNYLPVHGVPMPNWMLQGAVFYDPPSLNDGYQTTTTVTVTGAKLGDRVAGVSFSLDLQGMQLTAYVSAADTVTVVLRNGTGGTINLGNGVLIAETYR